MLEHKGDASYLPSSIQLQDSLKDQRVAAPKIVAALLQFPTMCHFRRDIDTFRAIPSFSNTLLFRSTHVHDRLR